MRLVIQLFIMVLMVFLSVCFLTLLERKILGYVQNRKGPTKVLFYGLLQPVIDGGKLIMKSMLIEKIYYFFIPFLSILIMSFLSLSMWFFSVSVVLNNSIFFVLMLSSFIVYVLFILGWSSENVYGVLGGLRSSSQMIAYEIVMFFLMILLVMYFFSWNLSNFKFSVWFILDLFIMWLLVLLVETNRSPYDFAEGESELVSGYNIEYMGVLFAYMFIAEYGMLVFFSWFTAVIFLHQFVFYFVLIFLIVVRGFIPRSRYDILMSNCWKFMFMVLSFLMFKFFYMWVVKKNYLVRLLNYFLLDLASPSNLLWFWNFGFMLGISMVIQVVSGFLLSLYYNDSVNYAFYSVNYLMLEVENGYELRFIHSSGASLLFFLIFVHMGRSIWYKSYYMIEVWETGALIFLILMMVSFLGYVLPWGQMSFWAATVITNLIYVIPYVGGTLLEWIWGGFSVGGPTLSRFFILHYIFPFVILVLSLVHLVFLHVNGSSNPLGVTSMNDKVEFHWFFLLKDLVSFLLLMLIFILMFLLLPYLFMDSENFLFVDIMKTPEHIKPEWYFLFAYCILRSVPNKLGGVIGLVMSIIILMLLPLMTHSYFKFNNFLGNYLVVFHFMVFFMLTWLGGCVVEWPYSSLGGMVSVLYFLLFFF